MYRLTPFERNGFDIFNPFNDFEKNFFGTSMPMNTCRTDIRDEDSKYVMEAELPGFSKEDIKLDINGSYLVLTAEHSSDNENKDEQGRYIRRERSYGSFRRSFDITEVNKEKIEAEYKNGILTMILPKKGEEVPTSRRLEIK